MVAMACFRILCSFLLAAGTAAQSEGNVVCWGSGPQSTVPADLGPVLEMQVGGKFVCVRTVANPGRPRCWGRTDAAAVVNVPSALVDVNRLWTGPRHACARRQSGTVSCWGVSLNGGVSLSAEPGVVKELSLGFDHTLALTPGGAIQCWGLNTNGQCTVPTSVGSDVRSIVAGAQHSCALRQNRTVICWGSAENGVKAVPAGLAGVDSLQALAYTTCARKSDGAHVCWGWHDGPTNTGFERLIVGRNTLCTVTGRQVHQCWGKTSDERVRPGALSQGEVLALGMANSYGCALLPTTTTTTTVTRTSTTISVTTSSTTSVTTSSSTSLTKTSTTSVTTSSTTSVTTSSSTSLTKTSTTSVTASSTTSVTTSSSTSLTKSSTTSMTTSSTTSVTMSSSTSLTETSTTSVTTSSTTSVTTSSSTSLTKTSTTSVTASSTMSVTMSSTTSGTSVTTSSTTLATTTTSVTASSTMSASTSMSMSSTTSGTEAPTTSQTRSLTMLGTQSTTVTLTSRSTMASHGATSTTAAEQDSWSTMSTDEPEAGAGGEAALTSSPTTRQTALTSTASGSGGGTAGDTTGAVPMTTKGPSLEEKAAVGTEGLTSAAASGSFATSTRPLPEADASSTAEPISAESSGGSGPARLPVTTTATTTLELQPEDLISQAKEREESLLRQLWSDPEQNVTSSEQAGTKTTVYKLAVVGKGSLQLPVEGTKGSVMVPVSALEGQGQVAAVVSFFSEEAVAKLQVSKSDAGGTAVPSSVVNVDLYSPSGILRVRDLAEPILVYIPKRNGSKDGEECAWWDEARRVWSFDAIETRRGEDGGLTCATTHLTLFASILRGFLQALTCTQLSLLSREGMRKFADRDWMSRPIAACLWLLLLAIFCLFLLAFELDRRRRHIFKDTSFLVPTSLKGGDAQGGDAWQARLREVLGPLASTLCQGQAPEEREVSRAAKLADTAADRIVMMSLVRQTSALLWLSPDAVAFVCKDPNFEKTMHAVRQQGEWQGAKEWLEPWHELQHTVAEGMSKQWHSLNRYCSVPLIAIGTFVQAVPLVSVFLLCPFRSSCLRMLLLTTKLFGSLFIGALIFQANGTFLDKDADAACRPEAGLGAMIGRIIAVSITSLVLAVIPMFGLKLIHRRKFVKVDFVDGPTWRRQLRTWRLRDILLCTLALLYCGFCLFFIMLFVANLHPDDSVTWGTSGFTSVFKDEVLVPFAISVFQPLVAMVSLEFAGKLAVSQDLRLLERVHVWRLLVEHPGSQWPLHAI